MTSKVVCIVVAAIASLGIMGCAASEEDMTETATAQPTQLEEVLDEDTEAIKIAAEEQEKQQEAEAAAEAQRQQEEAARIAIEQQRQQEEAAAAAEIQRQQAEAARAQAVSSVTVYIASSGNGGKFHTNPSCSKMNGTISLSVSDARAQGYTPCNRCAKNF